ncbi:MAG: transcriptional regulator [Desulfobacteraceae bacterium]|nr:MAG: transcriptional regulator [Desulfobacteraceae bacterium]
MPNRESQNIEFKSDWKDDCLRAISSLANNKGGLLKIGLDDRGHPTGLKNIVKLMEDIPNIIRSKLGITPSVELEEITGHDIINVKVSPSSVPISYNGKFYLRSGSTVQELQGKELADFLIKKSGVTWDDAIEDKGSLSNIDNTTIEDFKRFALDRIPAISREADQSTILKKLNLTEDGRLKRAAVLLFEADPQRLHSHAVVKIGRFLTDTDIQTTDIIRGNLFQQLEGTLDVLRSKYLLSNIKFEGIHRRDILEYPYDALREAIINALIHRDYRGFSQIQIRIYPDKLIIMNEGSLPPEIPIENLKTNHLSKPRNKLLAEVFYYAGFIEAWGRGTIKIVEKCLEQGLPEPDFKEESGVMTVTFYQDRWSEEKIRKLGLNERQVKAVMYVKEKGKITNKEYSKFANLNSRTSLRDLNNLCEKRIFEKAGTTGRNTYYILTRHKHDKHDINPT